MALYLRACVAVIRAIVIAVTVATIIVLNRIIPSIKQDFMQTPRQPLVKIYSTNVCKYCDEAKKHMAAKAISFENINVSGNPQLIAEARKLSGTMGVPVIVIGDKVLAGFDQEKFDAAYAEACS